jgi:hypothetical protein
MSTEITPFCCLFPSFYASDENGILYFYHGNTRIRVTEHFADSGKSAAVLIKEVIHHSAKQKFFPFL